VLRSLFLLEGSMEEVEKEGQIESLWVAVSIHRTHEPLVRSKSGVGSRFVCGGWGSLLYAGWWVRMGRSELCRVGDATARRWTRGKQAGEMDG